MENKKGTFYRPSTYKCEFNLGMYDCIGKLVFC